MRKKDKRYEYETLKCSSLDRIERAWIDEYEPEGWDVDKGVWVHWLSAIYYLRLKRLRVRTICKEINCNRTPDSNLSCDGYCMRHWLKNAFPVEAGQ